MSDELRKKAKGFRLTGCDAKHCRGNVRCSRCMADFAAECIAAERERADRLHAKLVEIERCYLESGTECSSCYDLFTIAVLAQEAK